MLKAFISTNNEIFPFKHVVSVCPYGQNEVIIKTTNSGHYRPYFKNEENRNNQLDNFKKWLTAKTNSI